MADINKEYLTISDFASKAGVTTQAIYLRLNKDLAPYCKVIDKRKMLDMEALSLYQDNEYYQECKEDYQGTTKLPSDLISYLQAEIDRLQKEITAKDALLASYTDKFAELAQREQEISARALQTVGQAQLIHGSAQDEMTQPEHDIDTPIEPKKKKGFFSKWFG